MGKIVTIEYVADLEGTTIDAELADTVEFSYRGQERTLVLTKENGAQFDKDIARYIAAAKKAQSREARSARKASKAAPRKPRTSKPASDRKLKLSNQPAEPVSSSPKRTQAVRRWAADNGYSVSARGRIPATAVQAYDAAL